MSRTLLIISLPIIAACEPQIPRGSQMMDKFPQHAEYGTLSWPKELPKFASLRLTEQNGTLIWQVKEEDARFFQGGFHEPESYWVNPPVECETPLKHVKLLRSSSRDTPCKFDEKFEVFGFTSDGVSFSGHCTYHRTEFLLDEDGEVLRDEKGRLDLQVVPIDPHWSCWASGTIVSEAGEGRVARVAVYFPLRLIAELPTDGF